MLMGISFFMVWRKRLHVPQIKKAVSVFGIQLALNVLWSLTFFGTRSLFYGFIVIVLLLIAILVTMVMFYRISKTAGLLLLPYFLWGSFATILNLLILLLNP